MLEKMTVEKAAEQLGQGFHCSQVVFAYAAEKLGFDKKLALKLSGGLGGGCFHGDICGAVSGGVAALGLAYGYSEPYSTEQNNILVAKVVEFEKRFEAINGNVVCKELLGGYNIANPEHLAIIKEKGLSKNCPKFCADACGILDDMIEYPAE